MHQYVHQLQLIPDPWLKEIKKYKVGDTLEGEVTRVTPFGAFVKLGKNVEGLVHISEMADQQVVDPREILSAGDKKKFKIISIEPDAHKLGLSLKGLASAKKVRAKKKAEPKTKQKVSSKTKKKAK